MKLDQNKALEAALKLLNKVGLEMLTMRLLASELGVQAPALYYHFASKRNLLDAMAEAIVAPAIAGLDPAQLDRVQIDDLARAYRQAMLSHRDGGVVVSGAYGATPSVLKLADGLLGKMLDSGLHQPDAVNAMFNLLYFIQGSVVEQQAFEQLWGSNAKSRAAAAQQLKRTVTVGYPHLEACLAELLCVDFDARFNQGLKAQSLTLKRQRRRSYERGPQSRTR
ncbi:TetR/AcrR family transcriptional regulator C-terminal domain-containing protein [Ottowia testudinis]|uniref:TetR/AcrR family transcriptional regulator C-terminal domain-containing protein n=1 Tax=Ottowia testudinis TaxID=2816950 RepID=A0A975CD66_9BURK|nr:TetR/AcrR family transcriptional regulator C-terminal domain-containing protein [Ottowia testudinis]QTD44095.1 TetR/AcrR family transcriptional regulator C-terminal domain-containing protein [Ottowia testudinis]